MPRQDGGMGDAPVEHRFYSDLAAWWPLISPPEDYAEEAAEMARLLASASIPVHEVLELGSGGGHTAVHLASRFEMTLVDLSPDMLEVSRRLNPGCEHLQGDMRTVRLGRSFDAVLIHGAVDYMTSEADLLEAVRTAYAHCRPGGVWPSSPPTASPRPSSRAATSAASTPRMGAVRATWSGPGIPDPADTWTLTEFAFLLRDDDGRVTSVHETHRTGHFATDTWLRLLRKAGFEGRVVTEVTTEDRTPRQLMVGDRPVRGG
jgi:SAM-dependent methyltransferase